MADDPADENADSDDMALTTLLYSVTKFSISPIWPRSVATVIVCDWLAVELSTAAVRLIVTPDSAVVTELVALVAAVPLIVELGILRVRTLGPGNVCPPR